MFLESDQFYIKINIDLWFLSFSCSKNHIICFIYLPYLFLYLLSRVKVVIVKWNINILHVNGKNMYTYMHIKIKCLASAGTVYFCNKFIYDVYKFYTCVDYFYINES